MKEKEREADEKKKLSKEELERVQGAGPKVIVTAQKTENLGNLQRTGEEKWKRGHRP